MSGNYSLGWTSLKTNEFVHENQWLEDVFPTEIVPFQANMLVSGGVTQQMVTTDFGLFEVV